MKWITRARPKIDRIACPGYAVHSSSSNRLRPRMR